MKVDDHGDSLWHRVYEYEDTRDAVETLDKGYVITGGRGRDGTVWLIKADSSGKSLWSRTYTDWEASYGNCVRPTSDGGYILAGSCTVDQTGRLLVIKTDSEGNMLWSHAADYESVAKCVHETEDGFLVAGRDSDAYKGLLLKLNDSGEEVWTQRYGSRTDFNWFEETADGGFILTGDKWLGVENYDVYIVKTDEEGNAVVAEKVDYDPLDWVLTSKIGREIVLRYSNHPQGFHASVFDASGRKVDELHSPQSSGTITWGEGYGQGVYFIISDVEGWGRAQKAVLVK